MKSLQQLVRVGLTIVLLCGTATAQTFTGGLRGAVRDANGVIPGVTVQLINEATAIVRDTISNESGEYNFPAVQPGTYTIKAALTGFKSYESTGVRIGTQQFLTIDIPLEVGTLQETSRSPARRRSSRPPTPRPVARSTAKCSRPCRLPAVTLSSSASRCRRS